MFLFTFTVGLHPCKPFLSKEYVNLLTGHNSMINSYIYTHIFLLRMCQALTNLCRLQPCSVWGVTLAAAWPLLLLFACYLIPRQHFKDAFTLVAKRKHKMPSPRVVNLQSLMFHRLNGRVSSYPNDDNCIWIRRSAPSTHVIFVVCFVISRCPWISFFVFHFALPFEDFAAKRRFARRFDESLIVELQLVGLS